MNTEKRIKLAWAGRKARDARIAMQRAKIPPLNEAYSRLRSSKVPAILDIIGEINDLADFQQRCEQVAHSERPTGTEGAHKKCRNCS